ncbi:hypothetical protein [Paenibacillus riograndensis]|uniref:Putative membrane protein n=1 Tax=Paenibacillus riograndensis SBR5 TaxID=1073571 RepID=A0A0E4HBR6_9BACL|nr:hypothetical protein [Paenibacillus riograndensis]CQR56965.1 putative membrane protein [Paenibacillus riograndensis SBR5]
MKILLIYAMLAILGLSMVISLDWLTGTPFSQSFNFLTKIFITTTYQELLVIITFLFLPVIQVAVETGKKKKKKHGH